MNNGNDEKFRLYMSSGKKEMEQLASACKIVSESINNRLRNSADPRPLINPVQVYVSSYSEGQTESHSHIWIAVNSSWEIAENARFNLESIGYKTGNIV
ncbi:hypothetical protein [Erwinia persicina]|uniref:Uncharacterized protein n=1 Tax=Erwinia persicina TaxID=55211 RepID=A0ABR8ZMZ7_9GAMM|nr:hypothetical protein [Erwinia persicina]MBC3944012.1 hypothetical protein [Erwinia persicina]MBD8105044.1 hypothetical protein [Erwinia persicina]MBD8169372.1 hypothetical protein [Erwinia persicina]MBD8208190.1 hypothetical protein [Erwinia persicina]MCQ4105383.1 hypothetical protein [Erwinia persicina]